MDEEWKAIEASPNYAVSNHGRVINVTTGMILKPRPIQNGYQRVHLPVKDGRKDFYIHRLVADAFCDHPSGCDVVNHIDFDVKNNRADNLEWTTQRSNVLYSMDAGRVHRFPNAMPVIGTKDGLSSFYRSSKEAGDKTGCDASSIIKCCKGKHSHCHGYKWRYAEVGI